MTRRCLLVLLALLPLCSAGGELAYDWAEGELYFPEGEAWTYRYEFSYPVPIGDSFAAGEIRHFFEIAMSEMEHLVLPMYAADVDMTKGGRQTIAQNYSVTLNDDRFFSILLRQRQTLEGRDIVSLSSQVFAVSGPYEGELLTLRGLVQVGESSTQIAEAVFDDVWQQVRERMDSEEPGWVDGLDRETFSLDFFPELHFFADAHANAVFFLQPGLFREDDLEITFTYSRDQLQDLLDQQQDGIERGIRHDDGRAGKGGTRSRAGTAEGAEAVARF